MACLDEGDGSLHMVGHTQPRHDHGQPPPAKGADCDLVLNIGKLSSSSATGAEHAHVKKLAEEEVFVLAAKRIGWFEGSQFVRELLDLLVSLRANRTVCRTFRLPASRLYLA